MNKSNLNSMCCQDLPICLCRDLAGMKPREVVEHDSDPANLLIHGLARMQEPEYIHSSDDFSQRQNNSLGGCLGDTYLVKVLAGGKRDTIICRWFSWSSSIHKTFLLENVYSK